MYDYDDLLNPANPLSPLNPCNPASPYYDLYYDLYWGDSDLEEKNQVEENKNKDEEKSGQTHQEIRINNIFTDFSAVILKSMMGIVFLLFISIIGVIIIKWIRRKIYDREKS
ncbi:hypothetical protein [Clostridium perfringens]|uniref:hypothetical protein n=1 Tax=Clostridium perfringens TaxID=1502 RepID=UPI0024BD3696|nr:hypothetical protein [Clostridium perfringens]